MTIQELTPLLTGAGGALLVLAVGNWWQAKEKLNLQTIIKSKDDDLKGLSREAITAITTLAQLNQSNQQWQQSVSLTLQRIEKFLPKEDS